ncbi:MAG TPA: hypothetical protein DDW52_16950 [Planctomycetaceae bacterium]|nr:hypothetical protein [Planctomycetaceae bacterium]
MSSPDCQQRTRTSNKQNGLASSVDRVTFLGNLPAGKLPFIGARAYETRLKWQVAKRRATEF